MFRKNVGELVLAALVLGPLGAAAMQPLKVDEKSLGQKAADEPFDWTWDTVSPDGSRVVWREETGEGWIVKVNGEPLGEAYEELDGMVFSADGQRLAHRGKRDESWFAVVDGAPGPPYREVGAVRFSPDGERVAYSARKADGWVAVVDGEEGRAYEDLGTTLRLSERRAPWNIYRTEAGRREGVIKTLRHLHFSPDGRHVVYPAKRDGDWIMVVDGEERGPEMRDVFAVLGFMPGSQAPVYLGGTGKRWSVIADDQAGPEFDIVAEPDFVPGEPGIVYAGARVKKPLFGAERALGTVIVHGAAGAVHEGRPVATIGLTGDALLRGLRPRFNARGHGVSSPTVSPDGRHVAYAARRSEEDFVVLLDGEAGPSFGKQVCKPTFSPDGRLFYVGLEDDKVVLMVDDVAAAELEWEGVQACTPPFFSEDGEHFAFVALEGGRLYDNGVTRRAKRRLFVDGEARPEYDARGLEDVRLYSKGEVFHWAYVVHSAEREGKDVSFVVVDGLEGPSYDYVLPGTLQFVVGHRVAFTAQRGDTVWRVTHELSSETSTRAASRP